MVVLLSKEEINSKKVKVRRYRLGEFGKCEIIERENYNKEKSENVKHPKCTLEKE